MDTKLVITDRELTGSANVRRLRRAGQIPGVIYGEGCEARLVTLPKHTFEQMLLRHAGDQMMVTIELNGKEESVLLKDIQRDVLRDGVKHVDFQAVSLTKKLKVQIAVELVGESEGVSTQGGVLDQVLHTVEVECLPGDILEKIELDVSALKLGDVLTVKEMGLDASKYEVLMDGDVGVVSILAPRVAVDEDEEGGSDGAEPEVINEKKDEE